jgi:signal transduction histidine kinase
MDNTEKIYSLKVKQVKFFDEITSFERRKDIFCLHIFIDQTNEKKLKCQKANREYQRLMMSSVAHEFRNPLNSIKGNLELIETV